jgi:hypothetical protein
LLQNANRKEGIHHNATQLNFQSLHITFAMLLLSVQCDWFIDVTWVTANGTVKVSKKGSEEAVALCGGIGLLGAITEFNLQLTPTSNTKFSTWYLRDDTNLAADVAEMLKVMGWPGF